MLVYLLAHLLADQKLPTSEACLKLLRRVKPKKNLLALLKIK
jgi:hypothetical protein